MYFRTRIFAISILTVSVVLAVVITFGWSRIMKVELDHLDSRLCMEAKRVMPTTGDQYSPINVTQLSGHDVQGGKLIDDLVDKLRVNLPNELMVFVESNDHHILTKSDNADIQTFTNRFDWENVDSIESTTSNNTHLPCQFIFFEHQQNEWRASSFTISGIQSVIAVDISATTRELKSTVKSALIVIVPFSLILSILGAGFIATNSIRPVKRLHKSMDKVTQKDLSHRLSTHKEDKEFKALIDTYNEMLNRLENSFQQSSRFTADAAHELKTPLTILRGKLEQAVISEDLAQVDLSAILDEVGHLSAITRKLLLLSQADSGSLALHLESINITDLLDELTADMELLSDDLVLKCTIERELTLKGDVVLLRQLLNNLLVNVMHYSLHDKGVTIQAKQSETTIDVLIINACKPISNQTRSRLFERFFRGEPDYTQGISGSGLGLGLAREIARAHGGSLTIEPCDQETFSIRLVLQKHNA
ncbi:ATP-binding protein [Vibrio sp. WJH972]